jgi:hypothetical protein
MYTDTIRINALGSSTKILTSFHTYINFTVHFLGHRPRRRSQRALKLPLNPDGLDVCIF